MTETMEWERCTNSHTVAYWLNMREDLVGNDGHAPDLPQRELALHAGGARRPTGIPGEVTVEILEPNALP